jgi:magnesium chelatase subunit I
VKPLDTFIKLHQPNMNEADTYFMKEFILWALVEFKKLSKYRFAEGTQFKDPYGSFISGL